MRRTLRALGGVTFLWLLTAGVAATLRAAPPDTLRVMTFNIWVGGESGKQPLEQTALVIQRAQADVVGVQESAGEERADGTRPENARIIAKKLRMNYFSQGDGDVTVLSRHKIVGHTPKKWGVEIELPSGRRVWLFNAHFAHAPYQPYQLLKIPYHDGRFIATAAEAESEARLARGEEVKSMLAELEAVRDQGKAIFVTGDFNEPSPLDWTEAVCRAGRVPVAVKWPTAAAVLKADFLDTYREIHPDPLKAPGYTWTPTTKADDPEDHHDRIDFVLASGHGLRVTKAEVVGERKEEADIVVTPYPSDHRAVMATVTIGE